MDNQEVRHLLLCCLLETHADEQARQLLEEYEDDQALAIGSYAQALLSFRQHGDSNIARKDLQKVLDVNKHVPLYLTGCEELPLFPPSSYELGSEEEAIICADPLIEAWENTSGAVEWLSPRFSSIYRQKCVKNASVASYKPLEYLINVHLLFSCNPYFFARNAM